MSVTYFQTLYNYNAWANQRVLDTAAQLSPTQLHTAANASFDSIQATLVHTMSAQWMWLSRWQGRSPRTMFDPADYSDLAAIETRWAQIEQDTQKFVQQLDNQALERVIEYANTKGQAFAYPLWQLLLHQVNHATQHRSEVAMILTQFGQSPGWLDFIRYLDLQAKSS